LGWRRGIALVDFYSGTQPLGWRRGIALVLTLS